METPSARKQLTISDQSRQALASPSMGESADHMIKTQIKTVLILSGEPPERWLTKDEVDVLVTYLRDNCNNFKVAEISVAYQYYIRGLLPTFQFDKFERICASFIERLLRAYNKDVRFEIMRNNAPQLPAHRPPPRDELMTEACLYWFNHYKAKKFVMDIGGKKYEWLVEKGLINFTPERIRKIRELLAKQEESRNMLANMLRKPVIKPITDEITDELAMALLRAYFDDLIAMGEDLQTLIAGL